MKFHIMKPKNELLYHNNNNVIIESTFPDYHTIL
jgi:hypothetical protein